MGYVEELFSLKDKTTVVIGGGGVLGSKMAEGLAKAGAAIALIDPTCEKAIHTLRNLRPEGVRLLVFEIDATQRAELRRAAKEIQEAWGRIDILINAPGINSATPFFDITEEEWQQFPQEIKQVVNKMRQMNDLPPVE